MKVAIRSFVNRPKVKPEVHKKGSKVETAGYISAERRIREMIKAGERLDTYRKMRYDSNELSDELLETLPADPTRAKGFDMADASMLKNNVVEPMRRNALKKPADLSPAPSKEPAKAPDPIPVAG